MRDHAFRAIDALVLPTMPTAYTVEQVLADPIGLNSRLGTYTNFVNLLELCGARGAGRRWRRRRAVRRDAAGAGRPRCLARLASGACSMPIPRCRSVPPGRRSRRSRRLAVCRPRPTHPAGGGRRASLRHGAQWRTDARSARASWRRPGRGPTTGCLRSPPTHPPKPGLLRVAAGEGARDRGRDLDAVAPRPSARFVAGRAGAAVDRHAGARRRPLVKGFLVEAEAVAGARDISAFGGWRAFVAQAGCRREAAHK